MLGFDVGSAPAARAFLGAVGRAGIPFSPSLADVRTTVSYPAGTSHRALSPDERRAIGVTDGLIRLSVGIEDPADVLADLDRALAAAKAAV
jgi:cystathionine beta-lyase/cystathionine gamma-synthase